jgi:hypothetical protein
MNGGRWTFVVLLVVLSTLAAATARAQTPPTSRIWIAAGGASTTLQGACGEGCELESPYFHTGAVLGDIGYRVNPRMDAGVEIAWIPATSAAGDDIRSTFIIGVAQFRPWESKGFSVKGGMGMAFVRNWVYDFSGGGGSNPPFTSKALGLTYSAGWTFRHTQRVSVQVFGAQHVATLGDLQTSTQKVENVIGNFWSVGAVLVFR